MSQFNELPDGLVDDILECFSLRPVPRDNGIACCNRASSSSWERTRRRLAQYNYSHGRKLSDMVKDGTCKFDDLATWEQQLVEDFDTRRSAKTLDKVMEEKAFKQQPYRGPGTETTTTRCLT